MMKVAVVLDPEFDGLHELYPTMPVWAVECPRHRSAAVEIWKDSVPGSAKNELTLFKVNNLADREGNLTGEIDTIELHHPGLTLLALIGISESKSLRSQLCDFGYRLQIENGQLVAMKVDTAG